MEYLNRIMEANNKSKVIIDELAQIKGGSYKGLTSSVTFDEFNDDKEVALQSKLQDLEIITGYYEDAYRNIDTVSGHEFTKISDYLTVDNVKEELNRRVKHLRDVFDTYDQ